MLRILLSFAFAASVFGADWSKLKPEGYVSDYAKVIDAGSRASIESYLAGLERASGAQIAIVTIDTLDGEPVSDVANKLFRQFGVGQKGKNEGALFLLAVRDRKSRLEVGYGLEPIVPDGVAGDILRAMRPALRASQYGPALIEAARVLGTKISASKKVELSETLPPRALFEDGPRKGTSRDQRQLVQILMVVGLIGLFALMSRRGGGGRRFGGGPWIFPGGGGGFGGASSGGSSWGGFGGGDSGGGGASSDW